VKKNLIIIQGTTASGKTSLAIDLAKYFSCPIISADARQFYKEMSIGTAKPSKTELEEAQHFLINSNSIHKDFTVAHYEKEASVLLKELFISNDYVILVGGSGLFIDALVFGLDDLPTDKAVQDKLQEKLVDQGLPFLLELLKIADPICYDVIDKSNSRRILRALEIIELTGEKYSSLKTGQRKNNEFNTFRFSIEWDRELLYKRIDDRVELMLQSGLVEEAKELYQYRALKALNTVGYAELFDFFDGLTSYEKAVELIKQHTRNYAKRQLTWLRRYDDLIILDPLRETSLLNQSLNAFKKL